MRKWILRFGMGAGLVLASTALSGCLFPDKPASKQPTKAQQNNAFNNTNPNGNQQLNSTRDTTNAGSPAPSTNNTRTSGTYGDPIQRVGATTGNTANTQGLPGTQPPVNNPMQPISATNNAASNGNLTPIATSNTNPGRTRPVFNDITPIQDPANAGGTPQPQLDPVPSAQPPLPVSIQSGDRQLPRYPGQSPPLMTQASEAQPMKPINPR